MSGPVINPTPSERDLRSVDTAGEFDSEMQKQIAKGRRPKVRVVIQVRHEVPGVAAYRAKMAGIIGRMKRRDVPEDEQPGILASKMTEGDSREWTDIGTYWEGPYRRGAVKMPSGEELEAIEDAQGAAEARVQLRSDI